MGLWRNGVLGLDPHSAPKEWQRDGEIQVLVSEFKKKLKGEPNNLGKIWRKSSEIAAFTYMIPIFLLGCASVMASPQVPHMFKEYFGEGRAYIMQGTMDGASGLLGLIFISAMGKLSDVQGRKAWVIVTGILQMVPGLVFTVVPNNLWFYFVANIICGAFTGTLSTCTAAVSDISSGIRRTRLIGAVLSFTGLSLIVMPIIAGNLNLVQARNGIIACAALLFVFVTFISPETLPEDRSARRVSKGKFDALKQGNFMDQLARVTAHRNVFLCLCCTVFASLSENSITDFLMLYLTSRFGFSPQDLGTFLTALGIATVVGQVVLLPLFRHFMDDIWILRLAYLANLGHVILYGSATQGWLAYVCVGLTAVAFLNFACVAAIITRTCDDEEKGFAIGLVSGIKAFTGGVGPFAFGYMFNWHVALKEHPVRTGFPFFNYVVNSEGFPFFVGSILVSVALLCSFMLRPPPIPQKCIINEEELAHDEVQALLSTEDIRDSF